jgi:hypothetical protein
MDVMETTTQGNGSSITQNLITTNKSFRISKIAVSPVNIISIDYDPWTKNVTVKFRFDDYYGRTYDIIGFECSVADSYGVNGRVNNWVKYDINLL